MKIFLKFWLLCLSGVAASWSSEELALYDLVEELNQNFYEFLGVEKDAPIGSIKKAYRKMSLQYHPDRNRAEDATEKFRQVVAVYEILSSTELREKYNNVLEFGLPDWRQPIFYYRRVRKFTWYEALIVILGIATLTHYLMMWAAYYEKKLVFAQAFKKLAKKKDPQEAEALQRALDEYLPKPRRLLPFLLIEGACFTGKLLYFLALSALTPKSKEFEEVEEEKIKLRPTVPRQEFVYEMATDIKAVSVNHPEMEEKYKKEAEESTTKKTGAQWDFDELSLLIKLSTEKYPAGTPNRWELMARQLNRTADDVTTMAGKLKNMKQEEYTKLLRGQQSSAVNESSATTEVKSEWLQEEQKQFEAALQKYPKGTEERWEKIAAAVPGKTKEECVARFKELAEMVRRRKAAA